MLIKEKDIKNRIESFCAKAQKFDSTKIARITFRAKNCSTKRSSFSIFSEAHIKTMPH